MKTQSQMQNNFYLPVTQELVSSLNKRLSDTRVAVDKKNKHLCTVTKARYLTSESGCDMSSITRVLAPKLLMVLSSIHKF